MKIALSVIRGVIVWLIIMAAETVNGIIREVVITSYLEPLNAKRVSFSLAVVMILAVATVAIRWIGVIGPVQLLGLGVLWAILTFCFEAFLVRPIAWISWEQLAAEYDPAQGGLMMFGLIFLLFVPFLAVGLRNLVHSGIPQVKDH